MTSLLLSLDDQSIQQTIENLPIEKLHAVGKIGQKLHEIAASKFEEHFRNHSITIDATYQDFGINEKKVKQFAANIRNITIQGWHSRDKEIAAFVQSNFHNLKAIEFKYGSMIGRHLRSSFKNIDTIVFNAMASDGNYCYHDDCLRYCESLRCLKYCSFTCDTDEQDKFNAILSQKYIHLEKVHFDFQLTPNLNNWTRFIQRNTSIKSVAIRFLNEDDQKIVKIIKPIVDNAINLRKFYLLLDFDARYGKPFNFAPIHDQLMSLEQRESFNHLGIQFGFYTKIYNFERIASLRSLKSFVVSHPDPCDILQEICQYAKGTKILHLQSVINFCPMGDHRNLVADWNDTFPNLKELHFSQVKNAYFLVSLFIARSPKLKRIFAHECKIVFDKNVAMSLKKFNDYRAEVVGTEEPLIIYTNQKNVASNYEFSLVKLKHVEFEVTEFNERNPFQCLIDDGIGADEFFRSAEKTKQLAGFAEFCDRSFVIPDLVTIEDLLF